MSERPAVLETASAACLSGALTIRAAALARRLAHLLLVNCGPQPGASEAADFLAGWAGPDEPGSSADPEPVTLRRLVRSLRLTAPEQELVMLAGLAEEHQGISATFRGVHPTGEPRPTLGLAALLLGGGPEEHDLLRAIVAEGRAFTARLLHVSATGPYFERSLLLADGVWPAMHGHDAWPAALPRLRRPAVPPGLGNWLNEDPAQRALSAVVADEPALILVTSADRSVGLARCAALAHAAGRGMVAARVDPADAEHLALLRLHATVRDAIGVAVVEDESRAVVPAVGDLAGPMIVVAAPGAVRPPADRALIWLPAGPVSDEDQREAWRQATPGLSGEVSAALAARHRLDPAITVQLGLDLRGHPAPSRPAVSALIRTRLAATLPPGVELSTPDVPWTDIVLPETETSQLLDAVTRLDHQAKVLDEWDLRRRAHALHGARLLFCGPPGTGKSLAARAVATAARTDLLVVDVSQVVSKWLGETEKNLSAAFEAAERTQAVLMLDEADVLFGARTEISDAHDRYANLETAYLLTRLDRFEGLLILTTNMRANIDLAFLRRVDYLVDFPLPDRQGRTELWRGHLPSAVLADDVDVDALARLYPVPGAWIRNVSVAGAFSAAADGGVVTQTHLVDAMRREYAKSSLSFPGVPPRRRHESDS